MSNGADNFYQSDKVAAENVTFKNQYHLVVAGNLFVPENPDWNGKNPAIVVGHPMGERKITEPSAENPCPNLSGQELWRHYVSDPRFFYGRWSVWNTRSQCGPM